MTAPIQDAVTLAADLARTPLQVQAKRVYDLLRDAKFEASFIGRADSDASYFTSQVETRIQQALHPLAHLMHEADCE